MDTVLLFALPLVGGLIFCSTWNFTRWRVAREDGHRLYFRAILFGALLFAIVAWAQPKVESYFPQYSAAVSLVKDFIKPLAKDKDSASAVADLTVICFLAMVTGWPLAFLLNGIFWKDYWLRCAIKKDELEAFLLDAADRQISIAVTMDDRKVYVGYVVAGFDPAIGRKCLQLLPLMSGHRDPISNKVNFTTFYTALYGGNKPSNEIANLPEPLGHLTANDFITVLPIDRIGSYRLFDARAYQEFQKLNSSPPPAQPQQQVAKLTEDAPSPDSQETLQN